MIPSKTVVSKSCSLGDLFQNLFSDFLSIKKHGSGECGLRALLT